MEYFDTYHSPIGFLTVCSDGESITRISFSEEKPDTVISCTVVVSAIKQLDEYFQGNRMVFDLPLKPKGTSFQKKIWNELVTIPFGQPVSYTQVALKTGDVKNVRAVGTANGKNPVAILIPCHRVIGSNGKLIGYAGGLWRKKWLLNHEASLNPVKNTLF
ncbi:MAG: methylated-DNA--[protein]-cysteine S-methyltransferase [Prolixibacteraceae bacterium]|jgi:methylated-DNA-[protein]-cysteine S-methyltransferase|nr:methylated-DNA--[protein]-cysteine S-methyltransferase [Prolixibacteraceae bacterium]